MILTKHSKVRAIERLMGQTLEGDTDEEKLINNIDMSIRITAFLQKSIKTSNSFKLEGTKYLSRIEGFDNYRAVIRVDNGEHTLITITPIH